jgi:O-antigen/teichoic acid export membrane protein
MPSQEAIRYMLTSQIMNTIRSHASKVHLTLLNGLINFTFQIYLARVLNVEDFGQFSAVWVGIAIISYFTVGFQNHATLASGTFKTKYENRKTKRGSYLASIMKESIYLVLILNSILFFVDVSYDTKIKISIMSISLPISILTSFVLGRFLGSINPKSFYSGNLWLSLCKMASAVLFLFFFENVYWMILWLLFTHFMLTLIINRFQNKSLPIIYGHYWSLASRRILLVSAVYWTMAGIDIIFFRLQADSNTSGIYSGTSNLAKIPLIISASINVYLLHRLSNQKMTRDNFVRVFRNAVLFYFVLILFSLLFSLLLNSQIINTTIGAKYLSEYLLAKQIASYSGLIFLGLVISFRFTSINNAETTILTISGVIHFCALGFLDLSLDEFLLIIWATPTVLAIYLGVNLLRRSKFVNILD